MIKMNISKWSFVREYIDIIYFRICHVGHEIIPVFNFFMILLYRIFLVISSKFFIFYLKKVSKVP